jgi:hypothetical protein
LLVTANVPSSPILVTLKKEELIPPKLRFLQEPHGITPQKTPFFIVTAVKTSNLTIHSPTKGISPNCNITPDTPPAQKLRMKRKSTILWHVVDVPADNKFLQCWCPYKQEKKKHSVALSPQAKYTD